MPRRLRRVTGSQPQRGGNKGTEVRPWLSRPMRGVLLIAVGLKFQRCADPEILRPRSEERRVGKECRSRWSPYH